MPRYQESQVKYCNKARLVLLAACISTVLLFYGLIELLAPQPKLRIKLDNDAELLALKLDFDGDGKITTSDIIAALSGDEKELEALENEMMGLKLENVVAMRKKELQIREKSSQVNDLQQAYKGLEEEAAGVVAELLEEEKKLEDEAISVVQEEEATIDRLEKEKEEIAETLEQEEEVFEETKELYDEALEETLNREEEVEGLLAEAEAELIQEEMQDSGKSPDDELVKEVEELKREKDLANAALKDQIQRDDKKIKMMEKQAQAREELNQKDLEDTKELVEALVAEKNQEDLAVEQMADEIQYLQEVLENKEDGKGGKRYLRQQRQ